MGLYRRLRETGGEGERTVPRLRLPDCMLSDDNSPGLRLAIAAGYTVLEGVKGREGVVTYDPPDV